MPPVTRSPSELRRRDAEAEHDPRHDGDDERRPGSPTAPSAPAGPVRSATARRQRATTNIGEQRQRRRRRRAFQLSPSNQKTLEPRTLRTAIGPSSHDSFGARERVLARRAVNASTRAPAAARCGRTRRTPAPPLRTTKFCDSRATPISVPSTVASTMPVIDRRSVLNRPSTMASCVGCVWRNVARRDREAGRLVEEVEAGGEAPGARRCRRSCRRGTRRRRRPPRPRRSGTPTPGRGRPARAVVGRRPSPSCRSSAIRLGRDQRYGGAYCRPPSDHSALRPRSSMPIGARLASKISP